MRKLYYDSFSGLIEVVVDEVKGDHIYLKVKKEKFPYRVGDLILARSFNNLVYKCRTARSGHTMVINANIEDHLPCELQCSIQRVMAS